jgi:hypothetical protein
MNNNLLQIKIKQRLNKLASFDYDNLECWMVQEAFNKAQLEWVRRMIYGINTRKEGSEQSTGLVDDLRVLMKSVDLLPITDKKTFFEATLPGDYLYYVRADVYANSTCCPDKRKMVVYEAEEANMGVLLTSDTKGPSFEWAETLSTLVGDKIRVYTNGEFNITDIGLVYYRLPRTIQFLGCVNPSTGQTFTANQECEFKDDIAEILVDQAAAILAGDIESMNQYQRESQEVQKNS